jgi:hypothetical protein
LQRKPANRLGLRGANEVKEHAWLKFYPWKDLYEKNIEAPFIPKIGDNFDAKYCNAPDKIGNDTKEKYESYLRDENFKDVFRCFTYYNEENKEDTGKNKNSSSSYTKDLKFNNPHNNISNYNYGSIAGSSVINIGNSPNRMPESYNNNNINNTPNMMSEKAKAIDKNPSNNLENKFLKLKKQSNSSSTANLLRQYRQSNMSQSTTNSTINYLNKRSGSTNNIN